MKRFIFSLESVLRQKKWLEEEAKRYLGLEMHELNFLIVQLNNIHTSHDKLLEEWKSSQNLSAGQRLHFSIYSRKLLEDMKSQRAKIKVQQMVVDEKTGHLNAAVIERKKIEKFKERSFEKYKVYKKRKEASLIDEVASNFTRPNLER